MLYDTYMYNMCTICGSRIAVHSVLKTRWLQITKAPGKAQYSKMCTHANVVAHRGAQENNPNIEQTARVHQKRALYIFEYEY